MDFRTQRFATIGFTLLACLRLGTQPCEAQQIKIEGIFPRQLARGQATLISVAIANRDSIQTAEISPSAGVQISDIRRGKNFQGALTWSELSIDVAADATPGDRTLTLVLPAGRTAPVTITIPSHVPSISDLRVVSAESNQSTLELQFAAADPSGDLGDSPYVWFMFSCGSEILPGVVHGKMAIQDKSSGVVRVSVPSPQGQRRSAAANGKCELQVRVSDSGGIESNTLKVQF
jgi:hypothetical protein